MPQALPYLLALQTGINVYQSLNQPKAPDPPPVLEWDQAMQRAQTALNPVYDQSLQDTLQQVQQHNIRRGFFGQAPGAAMSQDAAARLEGSRNAAISQLAQQMVGQSADQAAQLAALALNRVHTQQSALTNAVNAGTNLAKTFPQWFNLPSLADTLSAGQQAVANTPGGLVTPSESRLTPTFGSMGLANQTNPYTLQPQFYGSGLIRTSFTNPYR